MGRFRSLIRSLMTAGRLEWAIESNWADPFLFMTYQVVRPVFGALILVVMFKVVSGKPASDPAFAQLYVGNAFFILVTQVLLGLGIVIFEDRERFEMLRYIYLTPMGLGVYLAGRGLSKIVSTMAAILITLAVGSLFFGIPYSMGIADLPNFVAALFLGTIATLAIGVALAAMSLGMAQNGFSMPEGVSALFYLLTGAVFSIDILPSWVAALGRLIPLTYWLEAIRRSLLHRPYIGSLANMSDAQVLLTLSWTTAATVMASWGILIAARHYVISTGKLDQKTDH